MPWGTERKFKVGETEIVARAHFDTSFVNATALTNDIKYNGFVGNHLSAALLVETVRAEFIGEPYGKWTDANS